MRSCSKRGIIPVSSLWFYSLPRAISTARSTPRAVPQGAFEFREPKFCHSERSKNCAKRSSYAVEEPLPGPGARLHYASRAERASLYRKFLSRRGPSTPQSDPLRGSFCCAQDDKTRGAPLLFEPRSEERRV